VRRLTWHSAVPLVFSSVATSSILPHRTLLCIFIVVASWSHSKRQGSGGLQQQVQEVRALAMARIELRSTSTGR
jgi:hypothetical protein